MSAFTIGSLFSGIGLLDLGLELSGLGSVVWQCEKDPWCRRVLRRHWPTVEAFDDIHTLNPSKVDVVCGGFPCQPVSVAGQRRGQADERWLWPEFARVIHEAQPKIVIIENVPGLRTRGLRDVLAVLAAFGFDAEWSHFRASDIGAPHHRDRLWIVAFHPGRLAAPIKTGFLEREICKVSANADKLDGRRHIRHGLAQAGLSAANADGNRRLESAWRVAVQRGWARECGWNLGATPRVDDGSARGMDRGKRRKALGNSVVMPCARLVGRSLVNALELAQ